MTRPHQSTSAKKEIELLAAEVGFDIVRFTDPAGLEKNASYFTEFLEKAHHGEMAWMEEKATRRMSPLNLWREVNSIIMFGLNYGPDHDPLETLNHKNSGNISVYALGKDYHDIIKKRLKQIARKMHQDYNTEVKVFVDTAPVMEKPLAEKSGVGWQGKHTNLVSREFGSWLFLGSIFTTLKIDIDEREADHCGSCNACLNICPTEAFPAPYQLDARRCISYLTIEYKGHIAIEFRKVMGNRIYGCDDCLSVCPWNKYAQMTPETLFHPRIELKNPDLGDLATLDDAAFRQVFSGSPVKRVGRDYFIRNVMIAIGNSQNEDYIPLLIEKLEESSPYIRAMAIWALKRLTNNQYFGELKKQFELLETDEKVKKEWY